MYHACRGVVPKIWDPGNKLIVGNLMRRRTRFIFGLGGVMIFGVGILVW
jgi:hypothetical protein